MQLLTNPLIVSSGATFNNAAGTFDLHGYNWTMTGATLLNPGTIDAKGVETVTGLTMDTTQGSVIYNGTATYTGHELPRAAE